jgi:hypothetical protein
MPTTSNFGWTTPADTDLVKDGAAAIRTLGNGIDTSLVDLKGGTTGQVLSKTSNTDLDYTWVTPNVGDITEVQGGTGISVASGTGPIPVITNTVATAFDAAGDLVYGTGADTFTKLSLGTAGQVLKVNAGATAPEWGAGGTTFAGVSLKNSSGVQSIAHSTFTAITWAEEDFDTDAYHSTSSNTSRITIPSGKAGKYHITGFLQWDDNTSGNARNIYVYKNGTNAKNGTSLKGYYPTALVSCVLNLAVSDYIEIYVYQDSGSTRDTYPYGVNGQFAATYLGA